MKDSRLVIALAAFLICSLLSTARLIVEAPSPARVAAASSEIPDRSDGRFAALKGALPARGVIGYVGEPGTAGLPDYYLAQYALAPLVVDRSADHALVMGNFPASPTVATPENLHLVKDFGSGVLLFSGNADRGASKDAK